MITVFCVRPKGFNVGNDAIFLGLRHLLREELGPDVNIVQVPAVATGEEGGLGGLQGRTIHEMNLYGHGVIVGGGNLYENGALAVDVNALGALRPPLMLFSLSHGRIYDHRHVLVRRTDEMPSAATVAVNNAAALSLARDDATLEYLRGLGLCDPVLGGCPTLFLSNVAVPEGASRRPPTAGTLLSIRNPRLMSVPLRDQARVQTDLVRLIAALEAKGRGPVRILCHDIRDLAFASSLGGSECVLPDDVYAYLDLLRHASLVVSLRLHAFVPAVVCGTPAINISYDERSMSLVRTIGLEAWDVDFVRSRDVVADVMDRCDRLDDLKSLWAAAEPRVRSLEHTMRDAVRSFGARVATYAREASPVV